MIVPQKYIIRYTQTGRSSLSSLPVDVGVRHLRKEL